VIHPEARAAYQRERDELAVIYTEVLLSKPEPPPGEPPAPAERRIARRLAVLEQQLIEAAKQRAADAEVILGLIAIANGLARQLEALERQHQERT
jgi:hypothetical protein